MYVHSQVCIQGSLGEGIFTGLPLMLSGMRKALEVMDWQSSTGQMYEVSFALSRSLLLLHRSICIQETYYEVMDWQSSPGPMYEVCQYE
jgi:hypothetical protein